MLITFVDGVRSVRHPLSLLKGSYPRSRKKRGSFLGEVVGRRNMGEESIGLVGVKRNLNIFVLLLVPVSRSRRVSYLREGREVREREGFTSYRIQ